MEIIRDTLGRVEIGEPTTFANLTLFPLLGNDAKRVDYATLDEAIEQGWFEVSEVSEAGSVPELKVVNKGDRAVFMLDGEELQGCKQNRVLNLTILAPAGKTLVVPVSCVEQGRWARRSAGMFSSPDTLYSKARRAKMAAVSASYSAIGQAMSDQGALWREISSKAASLGTRSDTGAVSDIFEQHGKRVAEYERAFRAVDGQCGAIFAIGERLVGLELFGHPDLLRKMLCKIVRSFALDAIDESNGDRFPTVDAARELLHDVADGRTETFPGVGLGEDARIRGRLTTGAALIAEGRVVHLCAFRNYDQENMDSGSGRIRRASLRRPA
jgi:hypothetical protein